MQPIKQLTHVLATLADDEHYLFSLGDLQGALPRHSSGALKAVVSRAVRQGVLKRVCRGLYLYPMVNPIKGSILYHAAARLRADEFNYISLESVLSEAGVISQIPMNWITLMSSGRSHIVKCGDFGSIEFIHTKKRPTELADQLIYDARYHQWRASIALALRDMKATKRNMDLVDRGVLHELV